MKNNAWKKLKKENNGSELNLTVEDIGYVNKVCTYAESHGVGLIETQLLRKDLIGMGLEAKKEGVLLEERLGAVEEFAENIVLEGKREDHKEQIYTWIQGMGIGSILLAGFHGLLVIVIGFTLFLRNSSRNFMLKEIANGIMLPNWILLVVIAMGFFWYIGGTYLFDKLLEERAREYHLEKN